MINLQYGGVVVKKYIVRAVCLAAVFLLLCSTAFAGQSVTLDKYGVSFSVPDGMEWVATEKADDYVDGLKAELEKEGAAGMIWGNSSAIMVGISSGSLYEKYSFSDKKDQQVLESARLEVVQWKLLYASQKPKEISV